MMMVHSPYSYFTSCPDRDDLRVGGWKPVLMLTIKVQLQPALVTFDNINFTPLVHIQCLPLL